MSSFFLVAYLYKHFGGDQLMIKLMKSKLSGWKNILTTIRELATANVISMPNEYINKGFILRHLAVALWENDPYRAAYALFLLDPQYIPIRTTEQKSLNFPEMVPSVSEKNKEDSLIQYSFQYNPKLQNESEYYSITKDTPINIINAIDSSLNQVYFYITASPQSPLN